MGGGGAKNSNKAIKKQADYQFNLNQQAQQASLEANRVNQVNPWGSTNWSQDPSGRWTQTTTLDPAEQQRLDQTRGLLTGLGGVAQGLVGQVGEQIGKPMDWSQFAPGPTGAPTGPTFGSAPGAPQFSTDFGRVDPNALAGAGGFGGASAATERAREYELQKDLDYSGLGAMPEANDAVRQRVEDAMYERAKSRLDPQWQQREREALDRSYAMGQREGDPAMASTFEPLGRERNDAYNQAIWDSIIRGGEEQSRLFGLEMARRQQGKSEIDTQGQFRNEALMNQFQQGAFNAGQANETARLNASLANAAGIAGADRAQRGLLAGLDFNRQGTVLANDLAQRGFENEFDRARYGDTMAQQGFQNEMARNQEQSRIREQQIQEALAQRGLGLSEMGSVLGMMGQVQGPQFSDYYTAGVNAPDYMSSWDAAQQRKAQAQQGMMAGLGSLAGVAGTALGGPIGGALANQMFKTAAG